VAERPLVITALLDMQSMGETGFRQTAALFFTRRKIFCRDVELPSLRSTTGRNALYPEEAIRAVFVPSI
jgi:hypothetical protein